MNKLTIAVAMLAVAACNQPVDNDGSHTAAVAEAQEMSTANTDEQMSFYDFEVQTLDGQPFSFESLKGKRVLIVNTASECGFTPQYEQLQELYAMYGGDKFTIIGFPANNFGGQEPGSDAQIRTFCTQNYGVSFPMMSKISVVGDDTHPLYQWLTDSQKNGVSDGEVKWNFHKFTVDENGKWTAEYGSRVSPLDDEIVAFAKGE